MMYGGVWRFVTESDNSECLNIVPKDHVNEFSL